LGLKRETRVSGGCLNEIRSNGRQIEKLLEKMNRTPEFVREQLRRNEIDRRLNTTPPNEKFQKSIRKTAQISSKKSNNHPRPNQRKLPPN